MIYTTHKYPQNLWAKQINSELIQLLEDVPADATLVDAPCGNGIIASFVKHDFPQRKVLAIDLNADLLKSAYLINEKNTPEFKVANIFDPITTGKDNIWLLINSLYCLPDKEKLLQNHQATFKYIIAIFPDIQQDNYKYFVKNHPDFSNPSAMQLDETVDFFHQHGYQLIKRIGNTNIKFHIWNQKYKLNRLPNFIRNTVFYFMDKIMIFRKPQYALMIFRRHE